MNAKQIGLSLVLADFVALTGYAVYHYGYAAFLELPFTNAIAAQVCIDLIIALSFVVVWMWRDARQRGLSPLPYVLLTLTLGSIGPLAYMIRREASEAQNPAVAAQAA
jgi:MFS superfamily sulfate permease-like transporter